MANQRKPWIVNTINLVAEFFQVTGPAVRKWIDNGMPRHATDKARKFTYDLSEISAWRYHEEEKRRRERQPDDDQLRRVQIERETEEVELATKKLKYAKEAATLVDREAAKAAIKDICNRIRARLDAIPHELGATLPPEIRAEYIADFQYKIRLIQLEISKGV